MSSDDRKVNPLGCPITRKIKLKSETFDADMNKWAEDQVLYTINSQKAQKLPAVTLRSFQFIKIIGTGCQGEIWLARKLDGRDRDHVYAVKVLMKSSDPITMKEIINERNILLAIRNKSPYFVKLEYSFETMNKMYLVMNYVCGGTLTSFVETYRNDEIAINADWLKLMIAELVSALKTLHGLNIIHRDLKMSNVMMAENGHIVLCDFGLSFQLEDGADTTGAIGTPSIMAPEMLANSRYSKAIDLWSLGVLICNLKTLKGQHPFNLSVASTDSMVLEIMNNEPKIPDASPVMQNLIRRLLTVNPIQRLERTEKALFQFFHKFDWNVVTKQFPCVPMKWCNLPEEDKHIDPNDKQFEVEYTIPQCLNFVYVAPEWRVST